LGQVEFRRFRLFQVEQALGRVPGRELFDLRAQLGERRIAAIETLVGGELPAGTRHVAALD